MNVAEILEKWYIQNKRDLPWRNTTSPYHIWLSEIILQQTRVNQGLQYYLDFVDRYPRVEDLASAGIDEVLKLWQGLGYYTRARNLHATATAIVRDYGGIFPGTFRELIKLRGIGMYTAAAVASIAFKEPVALVDGNVYRLLARYYGIDTPIDTAKGKQVFNRLAVQLLDRRHPDIHNQAVMEFGALICLPKNPLCGSCPLSSSCIAFHAGRMDELPVKQGKNRLRQRYFNYLFILRNSGSFLSKRGGKDIWNSLYEFPLIETETPVTYEQLQSMQEWREIFGSTPVPPGIIPKTFRHQLTHQIIWCNFYFIKMQHDFKPGGDNYTPVVYGNLRDYAVPRLIDKYLVYLKQEGLM